MRQFERYNPPRTYYLSIFLKGEDPVTEICYSLREVLRALEKWERDPDFESAHLSFSDSDED